MGIDSLGVRGSGELLRVVGVEFVVVAVVRVGGYDFDIAECEAVFFGGLFF